MQGYHPITSTIATKVEKKDAFLKYWNRDMNDVVLLGVELMPILSYCPSDDRRGSEAAGGAHLVSPVYWSSGGTLLAAFQNKIINIWTVNGMYSSNWSSNLLTMCVGQLCFHMFGCSDEGQP